VAAANNTNVDKTVSNKTLFMVGWGIALAHERFDGPRPSLAERTISTQEKDTKKLGRQTSHSDWPVGFCHISSQKLEAREFSQLKSLENRSDSCVRCALLRSTATKAVLGIYQNLHQLDFSMRYSELFYVER
jgi:hypothetical protein